MDFQVLLLLIISISFVTFTNATTSCDVQDRHDCTYTIVCHYHPGNAWTPECEYEPYVTFIMTESSTDTLTSGFFGATNFDTRVRVFKAVRNNWTSLSNFAFRYYVKTIQMDLSGNKIEDIKYEAFKNLAALQSLNISNNVLQTPFHPKSFLITENRNTDLEILDLSHNYLSELTGDIFGYIPNLKKLYLQYNLLFTITEDCLSNLKNLTVLHLHHNQISALNMTLINLRSLKELDVTCNKITKLSGFEINRLVSLETIKLSHNEIEVVESDCFNQASNLMTVDLSHNRIKSPIETVMFANNNKLAYLDLYQNNITQIQDNAFQHTMLKYLNLQKNNLTGEITGNTFNGLKNLTKLDLSNHSITIIRNNAFSDAVNLVDLNLSQNNIRLIENSSFAKALSLNILDVSYNNVSNLSFLRNTLSNLTHLNLRNNSITEITRDTFNNQTVMYMLDISANSIRNIEANSLPLKILQYINVTENRLAGVLNNNVFCPGKFLRYLDLFHFKLTRIDKMAFTDLPLLARLNISHNELESVDPNNFVGMDNMYSLDLSYNKLSDFYVDNITLPNLKGLYLNNNNLTNITRTLTNMTGLLHTDLSDNNISELSDVPFSKILHLKGLHLARNKIKVFNNNETNTLAELRLLTLSGNELTEINLSYFTEVMTVDLSYNKISFFNSTLFEKLDRLQAIDLSGNGITQITPGTFQTVRILKLLNLSHNNMTNLRYGNFRGLHRTEVLDLSYNNIAEIDVDIFHECVELIRLTIDYNHLKTLEVERLIVTLPKLKILSLGGNPLSCKEIVRNVKSANASMLRQVEITSIDKIFHEDNVHGIKCGDANLPSTTAKAEAAQVNGASSSLALVIWCSVLTVIVLVAGVGLFVYKRNKAAVVYRESRLQLRSSFSDFVSSETQNDLLG